MVPTTPNPTSAAPVTSTPVSPAPPAPPDDSSAAPQTTTPAAVVNQASATQASVTQATVTQTPATSASVTSAPPAPDCVTFTDAGQALGLLTPLNAAPACGPTVTELTGAVLPLMSTPEQIPDVIYGLLDSSPENFCNCMAALDDDSVTSFFPTDGCLFGRYTTAEVLDQCASIGVDTTAQFCERSCHDGTARSLGSREDGICCSCVPGGGASTSCGGGESSAAPQMLA